MLEALTSWHNGTGNIISVKAGPGSELLKFKVPTNIPLPQRHVLAAELACKALYITERIVSGKYGVRYVHVRIDRQS